MIVSHSHQFIFVKTRKTAGTSLQGALATICDDGDIVTRTGIANDAYSPRCYRGPVNPFPYWFAKPRIHRLSRILRRMVEGERFFDHMFLRELYALKEAYSWRDYFKFCIERNPWDKVVSRYFWKYRDRKDRPDFEAFVATDRLVSDFDMYSINGEVAVDYVGRYETLTESIEEIGRQLGCAVPVPGRSNSSTRAVHDYRSMYSERSHDTVARHFAREIKLLGYSFDR